MNNKIIFSDIPIHIIAIVYSFHEENRNTYKKKISVTKSKNINKHNLLLILFMEQCSEELNYKYFIKYYVKFIQKNSRSSKYFTVSKDALQIFPNLTEKFINRFESNKQYYINNFNK